VFPLRLYKIEDTDLVLNMQYYDKLIENTSNPAESERYPNSFVVPVNEFVYRYVDYKLVPKPEKRPDHEAQKLPQGTFAHLLQAMWSYYKIDLVYALPTEPDSPWTRRSLTEPEFNAAGWRLFNQAEWDSLIEASPREIAEFAIPLPRSEQSGYRIPNYTAAPGVDVGDTWEGEIPFEVIEWGTTQ